MGAVYGLTLRQLSGRWRLAIMTVLATLPVIIAIVALGSSTATSVWEFEEAILGAMLAGSISPLIVLAIATSAFSNEIEDRTLANLTLAPIPRWQIVLPKLLAVITISAPFIAASAFLTAHIAFQGDTTATVAITLSAVLGVLMYASLFVWLGMVSTQAMGVGLLYIVLWEGLFAGFVSGFRLFSIRYFSIAVQHGLDDRRFAEIPHLNMTAAIIVSVLIVGGFLILAIRRLRRMDVP